jgi:hypothetical protein
MPTLILETHFCDGAEITKQIKTTSIYKVIFSMSI